MDFLRVPVTQERLKPSEGELIGFDGWNLLMDKTSLHNILKWILLQKFQRTDTIRDLPPG